ncbi:uncharacterized protein LOC111489811 isoform X5 [Cucurbita maxima]|uniref:Uncharacterized protein LOC111489811 isoform X5 n=1 Tax=Cucurbita maxima TaxID=3661 RepID=A0A6J1JXV0_CUCMA|nr:uncharacterized protein LOC111489811 isoform X5 [Cucurbita maxima]
MEEYLQYMKTLRLQMSDVEDQVSKISVEEHMHFTTIRTMENDLTAAKSELKQLKEDAERMMRAKGEICSQILEQQRKITSLEHDICTLSQVKFETAKRGSETEGSYDTVGGISGTRIYCNLNYVVEERKDLLGKLESAKAKLSQVSKMKCAVVLENSKIGQSIEEVKNELNDFKPELRAMDDVTLEEESKALLSDKAGETEYSRSLQDQIAKLKEISHVIKCTCGKEYKTGISLST